MTLSVPIRLATFNVSLYQNNAGDLIEARFELTEAGFPAVSSDHRWVGVVPSGASQHRQFVDGIECLGGEVGALTDSLVTESFIQV